MLYEVITAPQYFGFVFKGCIEIAGSLIVCAGKIAEPLTDMGSYNFV